MNHVDNIDFDIYIFVHDMELAKPVLASLKPLKARIFDGSDYPSFSKIINDIICLSKAEHVVLCSYKVRPTESDIYQMINYFKQGYEFIELYRFACFGLTKELIRHIGFFDERFLGGGFEDSDFTLRMMESQIPFIESETIEYVPSQSNWNYSQERGFHAQKWNIDQMHGGLIIRCLDDEIYPYKIGKPKRKIDKKLKSIYLPGSEPTSKCRFARKK